MVELLRPPPASVVVIGLGYIGLPTATALATRGVNVIGVDVNERVVESINRGEPHFAEPDLAIAVSGAVSQGLLRAKTEAEPADAFIVAVPTPFLDDHSADLSCVEEAAGSIAPVLKPGDLVVLESTSPPGTTQRLSAWLAALRPDLTFPHEARDAADIHVAHCPERVLPGRIMIEIVTNDRAVGGMSPCCANAARDLYSTFTKGDIHLTDATTAEMAKLSENAYRDVNIAFANEMSMVCDHLGIDVHEVIALANRHPRVNVLQPGPGVGGHCIAVDPWFIVAAAPEQAKLIRLAREVNDSKPGYVVDEVAQAARKFNEPVIACLGLTFKANVDDLRESPALHITTQLAQADLGRVLVVEPNVKELPTALAGTSKVELVDLKSALGKADIVVLLVDHDVFRDVHKAALRDKVVFDTRGIWR